MNSEMMNSEMKFSRQEAQKAQRGQPQPKELKLSSTRNENSPPLQRRLCLAWRRLPSLLCRRFPNLLEAVQWAGLEGGDTAGLETCATQPSRFALNTYSAAGHRAGRQTEYRQGRKRGRPGRGLDGPKMMVNDLQNIGQ
jgi:hypothetical protein